MRVATSGVTSAIGQVIHPEALDSDHEKALLVSAPQPSHDRPSVILMHDGGGNRSQTVDALGTLIKVLTRAGYYFATPEHPL
jgi:peptidoglycan/xylan/chitin deacetylase (PgdA/CDA1 family)